ncbi:MAG: hypothetical protein AAGA06_01480 [Pseudomonadota bacterium]
MKWRLESVTRDLHETAVKVGLKTHGKQIIPSEPQNVAKITRFLGDRRYSAAIRSNHGLNGQRK